MKGMSRAAQLGGVNFAMSTIIAMSIRKGEKRPEPRESTLSVAVDGALAAENRAR